MLSIGFAMISFDVDAADSQFLIAKLSQEFKNFGPSANRKRANENKDTGYSSSSSSSNGTSKSSLNCQNCTVLCDVLKPSIVGGLCMSCFHHWRY